MRKCNECGFTVNSELVTELRRMSDHLTTHNPTPAQWTEAYNKIQAGKEKAKAAAKKELKDF